MEVVNLRFLTVLFLYLVNISSGIIRNDLTDRCLHLRSIKNIKKDSKTTSNRLSVYARECSWDGTLHRKTRSHFDEHVEILPSYNIPQVSIYPNSDSYPNEDLTYTIRKVEQTLSKPGASEGHSHTCLASLDNSPVVSSNCSGKEQPKQNTLHHQNPYAKTFFKIDVVPQTNFKGILTSPVSFKIRNAEGNCLTIKPGSETLQFLQCSPRHGLFQVWNVCRHNKQCDVGLMWTPRKITFPVNASIEDIKPLNFTVQDIPTSASILEEKDEILQTTSSSIAVSCQGNTTPAFFINEVLYTIQNALKIYDQSELFLVSSLITFYPKEVLTDAFDLAQRMCQKESLKCNICHDRMKTPSSFSRLEATGMAETLIRWMNECNSGAEKKEFLSKDILQVLLHIFPISDSYLRSLPEDNDDKVKLAISSLEKYLKVLEGRIKGKDKREHHYDNDNLCNNTKVTETPSKSTGVAKTVSPEQTEDSQNNITRGGGGVEREEEEMVWGTPSRQDDKGGNKATYSSANTFKIPLVLDIDVRIGQGNKNVSFS